MKLTIARFVCGTTVTQGTQGKIYLNQIDVNEAATALYPAVTHHKREPRTLVLARGRNAGGVPRYLGLCGEAVA